MVRRERSPCPLWRAAAVQQQATARAAAGGAIDLRGLGAVDFGDDEPTVEIPLETMAELQASERPTRNIRPFRRPRTDTEYSVTKTKGTP